MTNCVQSGCWEHCPHLTPQSILLSLSICFVSFVCVLLLFTFIINNHNQSILHVRFLFSNGSRLPFPLFALKVMSLHSCFLLFLLLLFYNTLTAFSSLFPYSFHNSFLKTHHCLVHSQPTIVYFSFSFVQFCSGYTHTSSGGV